jgi:hypothetical protein
LSIINEGERNKATLPAKEKPIRKRKDSFSRSEKIFSRRNLAV